MLRVIRYLLWIVGKAVLSLRYRVRVHGLEHLRGLKGPTLVVPNHPGYIDPPLVLMALWSSLHPRPMIYEGNINNPFLYPLVKLLDPLLVPDLDQPSTSAREKAQNAIAAVIDGLRQGKNHILWPAGRVQRDGVERLGGAQALADILRAVPEAEVVLVRTRGVWGSCFSYAYHGGRPNLGQCLRVGLGWLLANLLLFAPRRRVDIVVERLDRTKIPDLQREKLNFWFEAWYNAGGPEPPTFVPYHFLLGPRTHRFPEVPSLARADLSRVKPATKEAVAEVLEHQLKRPLPANASQADTTLEELGMNSLDRMELARAVEQRFGFSGDQTPAAIGEVWALAQGLVEKTPPKPPPAEWFRPPSTTGLMTIEADTIPAAFVARALANPRDVAAADDLAGVVTYERLLVGALVMAKRFAKLPSPNVGLMLPASVACDIALFGLQLTGKLPVMLNWTTGPVNLAHAVRTMGLTHVVTSEVFLDRVGIEIEGVENLFLEKVRKGIGRWELLRTLLTVRWFPGRIRARVPPLSPDRAAVVLFTSGSEKAPKVVPLTHANIIADSRAGIPFLGLTRQDSMLSFLPAFHSFGLTVTGLMPLMGGMRLIHHPDPTDAAALTRKIAAYRPTMVVGTPTFVSYILDRAHPGDLASLRLLVVGAEKCPPAVFERAAQLAPGASILEGYGITECSPVVAVNRTTANRRGTVGQPMTGVEVCVVNPETEAVLPPNQMGELWISGPIVFPGYLAYDGPSPFAERDNKRWYKTGDLVEIDPEGFIHFRGRKKRFLKSGGEMISLPALEEPFARLYPPTEEGPRVAIEGVETEAGVHIVLFTTESLTLREANAQLLADGFRGVLRLDEVRRLDKIPVLGAGKINSPALQAMLKADGQPVEGAARLA